MPLTPEWAIFFSAELAVLATLTGLVVVAISINLPRILSYAHLPTRAGEALIGPVGAIIVTSLVLIPEQAPMLLGSEVILIGLVMVVAPVVFQARAWSVRKDAWERYMRGVSTTRFSLPLHRRRGFVRGVASGALLDRRRRHSWHCCGRA
jgi:hypothetical protein